ncbi:hypothetical protein IE53DRAFT_121885 [Violaceomyces palustris]|uniref:Uncharacterized protein n=1 Tax=Violaceomyces palustris TaxID=1673888 RepID=A0ACD0P6S0_9BASI|nr:hypothetical protein IE53DRAFT_121885 [Violaceomyces palustris]
MSMASPTLLSPVSPPSLANGHSSRNDNISGYSDVSFSSATTADTETLAVTPLNPSSIPRSSGVNKSYLHSEPKGKGKEMDKVGIGRSEKNTNSVGWVSISGDSSETLSRINQSGSHPLSQSITEEGFHHSPEVRASTGGMYVSGIPDLDTIDEAPSINRTADYLHGGSRPRNVSGGSAGYPPTSEEDAEAKQVQQNLERWAAEERQRRKAARASKTGSQYLASDNKGNSIVRRLSSLRSSSRNTPSLGSGPSSERLAIGSPVDAGTAVMPSLTGVRRESLTNAGAGLQRNFSRAASFSSSNDGASVSDMRAASYDLSKTEGGSVSSPPGAEGAAPGSPGREGKGKARQLRDPFRDPSENGYGNRSPESNFSSPGRGGRPTPTALRPIVTVGRASSIQRRAMENNSNRNGPSKGRKVLPSIVATDTELETQRGSSKENPFVSNEERGSSARPEMSTSSTYGSIPQARRSSGMASTTLHEGEEEGYYDNPIDKSDNGDLAESGIPLGRPSTSSSKFREIINDDEEDDWATTNRNALDDPKKSSKAARDALGRPKRKPWWTEWLCGCGGGLDDEEQAGRTNPME